MHEIIFDKKAVDYLNKLPETTKKRIYKKIITTKEKPPHFFERLKNRKEYKLRIGDYRVIADINHKRIAVLLIGHRKNIYKKK
ncbi:MAG: type II toxin-antitoxin system RelE family toxin [Candidatus Heimdallarchaeaceae archaeon]